jgi:hypothetical protein
VQNVSRDVLVIHKLVVVVIPIKVNDAADSNRR